MAETPRPYQVEARDAVFTTSDRPQLVSLPTGTGKTKVMEMIALRWAERSSKPGVVLVPTDELVQQAVDRFQRAGFAVLIEKAERRPSVSQLRSACGLGRSGVLMVASVASLHAKRLQRFPRDFFAFGMVDEAHRATAKSYQAIMAHLQCPWVGVTASWSRKGLEDVFDLAYSMDLSQAIEQGWLVPDRWRVVPGAWDLRSLTKPRGNQDVPAGELERLMAPRMAEALRTLHDALEGRRCLAFWPSVALAHACAEGLHALKWRAVAIDGGTEKVIRRNAIRHFRQGLLDVLSNCAVLTEGFDAPAADLIALCRPTRSRVLYEQMVGRGMRPLPGVIDHLGQATAEERRAAIAASAKPHCVLLDFQGSGAKFDFQSPITLRAGADLEPDVLRKLAERMTAASERPDGASIDEEAIEAARIVREERAEAQRRALAAEQAERIRKAKRAEVQERILISGTRPASPMPAGQRAASIYAPGFLESLEPHHATRYRGRAEDRSRSQASPAQRNLIYGLTKELFGQRQASGIYHAALKWTKTGASAEITYLQRVAQGSEKKAKTLAARARI